MLRCPTQAIVVDRENRTWECNHFRCITCGNCVESCPADCLHLEPVYRSPVAETSGTEFHEIPAPPPKPEAGGRTRRPRVYVIRLTSERAAATDATKTPARTASRYRGCRTTCFRTGTA